MTDSANSDRERDEELWDSEADAYDDENGGDCTHCSGEGYDECWDPIECTHQHRGGLCPCSACGGSGRAKDQTIW